MKKVLSEEKSLIEPLEGPGRFNLRRSAEIDPVTPSHRRTSRGPRFVITNRPRKVVQPVGYGRVKYVPKIVKDAYGNDVRVLVPKKKRTRSAA